MIILTIDLRAPKLQDFHIFLHGQSKGRQNTVEYQTEYVKLSPVLPTVSKLIDLQSNITCKDKSKRLHGKTIS